MTSQRRFRILTPDGTLSRDTFALPAEQPRTIKADCVLVIDQRSGRALTVHGTRLFPVEAAPAPAVAIEEKHVCLKCGKVQGVVEDQVSCLSRDGSPCGLLESSKEGTRQESVLVATHSAVGP
jgi:hypothetical protein